MPPDLNKLKKYLLQATGGVKFPAGACPDFFDFSREAMNGAEWWPRQQLALKLIINQWAKSNPGMPECPLTLEEQTDLAELIENGKNPIGDRKYKRVVINYDPKCKDPLQVLMVIGRGAGKSVINSTVKGYGVRYLLSLGDPHKAYGLARLKPISLQSFAGKESQVLGLFTGFKTVINNVRDFKNTYDALQKSVNFGGVIEAVAHTSSANTSRGKDTFVYDHEECCFCGEDTPENDKSFTKVHTAILPAVKNRFKAAGLVILPTSAGMKIGRTWKLYQDIISGKLKNAILLQFAIWEFNPSFQKSDFDQEYAVDFVTAEAEHGSQFVDVRHKFLSDEEVDFAIEKDRTMLLAGHPDCTYWIHLDPSRKHDRYALAMGHKELRNGRIVAVIDHMAYWQSHFIDREGNVVIPTSTIEKKSLIQIPIKPQEVYEYLETLINNFAIVGVSADQFESGWIIDELNARYGTAEEPFAFIEPITRKLNWLANRMIKKLINTDAFKTYPDEIWEAEARHVMRWNKNKPLDTVADDLWGDFEDDQAIDDPNLIYTVEAPRSGKVKTDDGWDATVFCTYKMMTNPDMTPWEMVIQGVGKRETAKINEQLSRQNLMNDMPDEVKSLR
jgi:hypothetical protein